MDRACQGTAPHHDRFAVHRHALKPCPSFRERGTTTDDKEHGMSQLLRVQCCNVSRDGFGAGEGQSLEHPFGHANPADLFSWAGATASWVNRTDPGGSRGLDDYFTRDYRNNIGAEIMGRNKFGPKRGPWKDEEWQGWWGGTQPLP